MTFEQLMQQYVNYSYDELMAIARNSLNTLIPVCQKLDPEHKGMFLFTSILLAAVGADRQLSAKERQFIADLTGLDEEKINVVIGTYNSDMENLVNTFADKLSGDVKVQTACLISAIAACDGTITYGESDFILKVIQ